MTIKNRRKHAKAVLDRNKSLVDKMSQYQMLHDIHMYRLEISAKMQLANLIKEERTKLNEYKKQAEAYVQKNNRR